MILKTKQNVERLKWAPKANCFPEPEGMIENFLFWAKPEKETKTFCYDVSVACDAFVMSEELTTVSSCGYEPRSQLQSLLSDQTVCFPHRHSLCSSLLRISSTESSLSWTSLRPPLLLVTLPA